LTEAVNTPEIPSFIDGQGKLVYDIAASHSLTILSLFADSKLVLTRERALDLTRGEYGDFRAIQSVSGVRWRWNWGAKGAATTTLSYSRSGTGSSTRWTASEAEYYRNRSDDRQAIARASVIRVIGTHTLETGFVLGRMRSTEDFSTAHYYAADGENILPMSFGRSLWQTTAGTFLSDTWSPSDRFSLTLGSRLDYAGLRDEFDWSPRASARWNLHRRFSVHGAAGWYHQNAPAFLLMQIDDPKSLSALEAKHEVIGVRWEPTKWVNLSLDLYAKQYSNFPIDESRPYVFVVDDATSISGFIYYPGLSDGGRARAKGVEFMAELQPASTLNATLALTASDTRYRDGFGNWHERQFNTNRIVHATVNYHPSPGWRFNTRWSYSGGAAYTPFDARRSALMGRGIPAPRQINSADLPVYHSLHFQVERRWAVRGSNLAAYLGVMNAYNRKNVAYYYWNYSEDVAEPQYQWGIMPVIGLRCEF
jgi:outer membrane receptor for ferrienterochelin and colicin